MSAGVVSDALRIHDDLDELAPLFRSSVARALEECARQGLDAIVYEAYRTQELQAEYFARGRTKRPPFETVTNAPSNLHSWHGYGLAVDVISRSRQWSAGTAWFRRVAEIFKANNCKWGGDWTSPDLPHFQWHLCKASPSTEARHLIATQGTEAVWRAVRAVDESALQPAHPPAVAAVEEVSRTAVVTAKGLNLRPDPSTTNPPLASLQRGTRIDVIEPHGSWFRVRANGRVGFVHGDHIALRDIVLDARFLAADELLRSVALAPAELRPVAAGDDEIVRVTMGTWNRYGGLLAPLCQKIGIAPAAAVAVLCVESGGRAFHGTRMIIRFEAHIFFRLWGKNNEAAFRRHFRFNDAEPWRGQEFSDGNGFKPIHEKGQSREWQVFEAAAALNRPAALRSISMGAPQIMGFNHGTIGYDDVEDMFEAFQDERFQILGMFDFIKGEGAASRMVQALQQQNYEAFATRYNGAGQAAIYGARIRRHAEAFPQPQPG